MGPQFTFKSIPGVGVGYGGGFGQSAFEGPPVSTSSVGRPPRSSPVNMPGAGGANVPVLIEAGSLSKFSLDNVCKWSFIDKRKQLLIFRSVNTTNGKYGKQYFFFWLFLGVAFITVLIYLCTINSITTDFPIHETDC